MDSLSARVFPGGRVGTQRAAVMLAWAWSGLIGLGSGNAAGQDSRAALRGVPAESTAVNSAFQTPAQDDRFDGQRAFEVLEQIVALGPRKSGSPAMRKQQELLQAHFESLGGLVQYQEFKYSPPSRNRPTTLRNLIVIWNPQAKRRVLICTHYDTRPYADQDPKNKRAELPGANDGASGTALLHELGRHMSPLKDAAIGVDFVFFDAEEYVFNNRQTAGDQADPLFVGSAQFAREYSVRRNAGQLGFVYDCGVLLDMVGDKHLELYWEKNSMANPTAKQTAEEIWAIAQQRGYGAFHPEIKHEIRDDHLMLNAVGIPTCDVIDFDYPDPEQPALYWHTTQDTPDKCSAESLQIVGSVMLEWIEKRVNPK
jgi:hypothetical protein